MAQPFESPDLVDLSEPTYAIVRETVRWNGDQLWTQRFEVNHRKGNKSASYGRVAALVTSPFMLTSGRILGVQPYQGVTAVAMDALDLRGRVIHGD